MKKIIFILALFVSFVANSQYTPPTGYTNINSRYDWLAGVFRALGLPAGGNASFTTGQAQRAGSVYYDSTGADAGLKVWNGAAWVGVGEVTQSALDDTAAAIRGDFPALVNIYNTDGVLSGARIVDANSNNLTFSNLGTFTISRSAITRFLLNGSETTIQSPDGLTFLQAANTGISVFAGPTANNGRMSLGDNVASFGLESSYTTGLTLVPSLATFRNTTGSLNIQAGGGASDSLRLIHFNFSDDTTLHKLQARNTVSGALVDTYWPVGGAGGFGDVGADFVVSNDSLKNNEWVNIVDFGAVGDGVTDNTAAILAARDSGKDIMVPEGIFDVTGAANTSIIVLNRGQKIFGVNRFKSILKTTAGVRILDLEDFCSVDNLGFLGDGSKTATDANQTGIVASTSDTLISITNCYFKNLGGSTAYTGGAIRISQIENGATVGGTINNNIIEDCYNGIILNSRGEYISISNNKITNSHVGLWNSAGNTAVVNNTFQSCDTAYILFGGTNNGHCISSANTYNHNTVNLVVDGITNGHTFNGDMLYAGDIVVRNSDGIKFLGCDFSTGTITLTNNTNLYRSGRWLTMTKSLVSGEDFTVLGETKTGAGAITVFDLLNASDTAKLRGINILSGLAGNGVGVVGVDNNGQLSWSAGGSNTDDSAYHRMSQVNDTTVVFHSNVADDTLVIRGGSAGIGGGSSGSPGIEVLTSGTTWTTDSDITASTVFKVTLVGGGGGGGGHNTANDKSGGGGGGGALIKYITGLTASTGYTYAIGASGPGATTAASGTAGGNTTLTIGATTYTGNGGNGGVYDGSGGTGGTATNGDVNISGQNGGSAPGTASGAVAGTAGGSTGFGLGQGGAPTTSNGADGTGYGGGGGGGMGVGASGGDGTQGVIIIERIN